MKIKTTLILALAAALWAQLPAPPDSRPDHQNMMEQLGIKKLRPGPSGNESAPNHANYDESTANPYPNLPDVLTLKNGKKVTTPEMWWKERRPEIVEDFEREVIGRVPKVVPKVTWTVAEKSETKLGPFAVVGKQLVGHVDNSSYPAITVDIQLTVVTPANGSGPVPLMILFGRGAWPPGAPPPAFPGFGRGGPPPDFGPGGLKGPIGTDPPATQQLIANGWGYAYLNPGSVQADNGAGLTAGIIGLVNHGQPRKPDDWGSLRAWAWGAARGLDYLESDSSVDAKKVGIEGVSRYGKAALVTMAFETRFAAVLVGTGSQAPLDFLRATET